MDFLTDPFSAEFLRTGAIAAAAVGVLCGVVGCYVLLRGQALVADSLAHGILPGIGVAFLLTAGDAGGEPSQVALSIGAAVAGLATALATNTILRRSPLRDEAASAVVFVLMLALGVVVISRADGYSVDLTSFLFGDVLGVSETEAAVAAALVVGGLVIVAAAYRPLLLFAFDPRRAAAAGFNVERLNLLLLVLVTLTVVVGFRIVGTLLVLGLLLAPPAAAALVTRRLPAMMAVSAAIAAASAPAGLLLSWHLDLAAGASIVLVSVAVFVVLLVVRPQPR